MISIVKEMAFLGGLEEPLMMAGSQASLVGFTKLHQQVPPHILWQSSLKSGLVLPICLPTSSKAGCSQGCQKVLKQTAELSKEAASPGVFDLKNVIHKEMPSRVAGRY